MNDFARYLAAKRSVDDRALNGRVWRRLENELKSTATESLRILDAGAGIGTGAERIAEWRLVGSSESPVHGGRASEGAPGGRPSPTRSPSLSDRARRGDARVLRGARRESSPVRPGGGPRASRYRRARARDRGALGARPPRWVSVLSHHVRRRDALRAGSGAG